MINPHPDSLKVHVEWSLKNWANWYVRWIERTVGYPSLSSIANLTRYGCVPIDQTYRRHPQWGYNPDAEAMDQHLNALTRYQAPAAYAVKAYYAGTGKITDRAQALGMSYRQFNAHLESGKHWLAGCLSRDSAAPS